MTISEYVLSGGLLAVIGLIIKTYNDVDNRINKSYKRLDEVKAKNEETFTRKDVCAILHTQINDSLIDIKADLKVLLNR